MSELSKQALKVDNNQSFPNNNNGAITPSILRAFNENMIDSNVNQTSFDIFSSSVASEFASITASVDPSITGSSLITASFDNGTRNLTFTKGDSTTFNVNIPDVSGSTLPSGLLSSSVTNFVDYSASVDARILAITGSSINTGSLVTTSSFNSYTSSTDSRLTNIESTTASLNSSITNINSFTQSANQRIGSLEAATSSYVTSAITASSLVTASVNLNTITFTKGDASTFNITVNTGSGGGGTIDTGSFATTGSNTFFGPQFISGTYYGDYTSSNWPTALVVSGGIFPYGDNMFDIGSDEHSFNKIVVNGELKGSSLNTSGRGRVGTLGFGNESLPLFVLDSREIVGSGQDANTHMYYGTSSSNPNALREFVYTQSGSNADFGQVSASFDSRINGIVTGTGFATTGSNTFYGNQTIATGNFQMGNGFTITAPSGDITNLAASNTIQFITEGAPGPGGTNDIKFINRVTGSKIIFENTQQGQGNGIEFTAGYVSFDVGVRSGSTGKVTFGSNTTAIEALSTPIKAQRLELSGALTASLQQGYTWVGDASGITTLVATSSFGGGGGTTYTNPTLNPYSGSLILVANTFTSSSFAHISASANGQVNLVFKNNNNTGDTVISGSNNIFTNPTPPSAGFKRYILNGNLFLTTLLPQISASMQFSPGISNNVSAGGSITMRGPVSASIMQANSNLLAGGNIQYGTSATLHAERLTGQTAVSNNIVAGGLSVIGNQSNISSLSNVLQNNVNGFATIILSSSAAIVSQNSINDGNFNLVNQFSSGAIGIGQVGIASNTLAGSGNTLYVTGSQLGAGTAPQMNQNLLLGNTNTLFVNASESRVSGSNIYHNALATGLIGQRLIVTGSSNANDASSFGSLFVGRNNAVDGIRNKSSDVVFAVGTGISSSADTRKTGFLIDSGSNTFVEGTLNVSGSTTLSGSLYIQSASTFPTQIGTSLVTWDSTTGQIGQATTTTLISSSFSAGEFYSMTTLSGSGGVSASINLPNTAISNGVTIQNDSQITVQNTGVYNIQFSAQCDAFSGTDTIWIWFKKNGTNISDSASKLIMQNNTAAIMTVNIFDDAVPNDYFEVVWQNNAGDGRIISDAASGNIPGIPSVIVTVNQVK